MKQLLTMLTVLLVCGVVNLNAQTDIPRGVFLFRNTNVDYENMKDSLNISWVQGESGWGGSQHIGVDTSWVQTLGLNTINIRDTLYNISTAQRMVFQAGRNSPPLSQVNMWNFFSCKTTGKTISDTIQECIPNSYPVGYMAKSPNPNNNYFYGKLGYFVTFQMAIIKESPPTDSVALLSVEGFSGGKQYSLDSVGVFDYSFQGSGTYQNFVLPFSVQVTPPPIRPLRFTLMGYNLGNNTITLYDSIDVRVYWCGKRTTYLANVTIDDSTSSNLYSGMYDGAIQTEVNQYVGQQYTNMQRLYLQDEPLVPVFLPLRYIDSKLQSDFGTGSARGRAITANWYRGNWLSRFLQDAQPNEYLFDGDYVIDASVPSPSMNAQQASAAGVAPWLGNGQYTISVQMKFDTLTGNLHSLDSSAQITSMPWWAVPQLHGKFYRTTPNHGYRDGSNNPDLRPPTGNELTAMINTEIVYGAKGIIAYPYGTDLSNDSSFAFPGLVSLTVSSNGIHEDHYSNMGWLPTTGGSYDSIYTGYKEKWDALAAVNANLKVIGPTLATLTWQGAMSWNTHIPSGNWSGIVTNISTNIVADTLYIETGDFKAGSTDYVYVVNRRTLATDSRNITVTLNTGGTSWEISDVASGNSWIVGPSSSGNYFTDSFQPGQGKLYKVGSATYTSTRTIAAGTTMTVSAGATAQFAQNTSLTVNGKLIVNGTSTSKVTFTQSTSNGWNGIALNHDSSTIQNCIISYASSPLTITNVNTATITLCTINNSTFSSSQAVSISNSTPTITSLEIDGLSSSSNGVRYTTAKGGTLNETTIQNCGAGNGIVIQGNPNPTISNCFIENNHFYGIILIGSTTGVPLISANQFIDNGGSSYFNLYFSSSAWGTVQQNYITGSLIGVGSYSGSSVTAGSDQNGLNTIIGNSYNLMCRGTGSSMGFGSYNGRYYSGTCNNIYGGTSYDAYADGGATIEAEYNWWNQSPPNTSKIYAGSGSYIDYSNSLTSQGGCPGGGGDVIV
ncbi:MAG: right-handed parallel beta-helix repeat-containing protein, partial [Bacteroidota bacterium]